MHPTSRSHSSSTAEAPILAAVPPVPAYSFDAILRASERVQWSVDDLIGGDKRLDFSKPFMPETFARTSSLEFLSPRERLVLNQIRGHTYLRIFGLAEEYILPFVMDHVRAHLADGDAPRRAFLNFAGEEAKHMELFRRFREQFEKGFGHPCEVIGPPEAVAKEVLSHDALAVALHILHIEWMTQKHFVESVRDDSGLDPLFKSMLRHHWMEEAQHAKLDTLMVEALAATLSPEEITKGFEGYLDIGGFLDAGMKTQSELDLKSLEGATGRTLDAAQREKFLTVQHQANRWTYLGSGMTHPNFLDSVGRLSPLLRSKLEAIAPTFS